MMKRSFNCSSDNKSTFKSIKKKKNIKKTKSLPVIKQTKTSMIRLLNSNPLLLLEDKSQKTNKKELEGIEIPKSFDFNHAKEIINVLYTRITKNSFSYYPFNKRNHSLPKDGESYRTLGRKLHCIHDENKDEAFKRKRAKKPTTETNHVETKQIKKQTTENKNKKSKNNNNNKINAQPVLAILNNNNKCKLSKSYDKKKFLFSETSFISPILKDKNIKSNETVGISFSTPLPSKNK